MNTNESVADKIEEVVQKMFSNFRSVEPKANEYSIFHTPKKHSSWFIVIFFAEKDQLKKGLENGGCYQVYKYLVDELDKATELSNIERFISFEYGNRPVNQIDIDNLFELLLKKQENLKKDIDKSHVTECGNCRHNMDNHQLLCNMSEDGATPAEGWMICPEEDCNCFQTWSANYKTND